MTRHVGVMVGDALPSPGARRAIDAVYRERLARAPHTSGLVATATLDRAWACDAALYHATQYAGDSFLLVGDAGSFIDPLSSFGVKKALASAWLGAVAVHTALIDRERRRVALDFFDRRERQMYAAHLERSRSFAQSAWQQHPDPFWKGRADAVLADVPAAIDGETTLARDPAVVRAFERIRTAPRLHLAAAAAPCIEHHPVVRGQEIVLEPAFADGVRFFANVDLLELAKIAPGCRDVPDLFEAYCRRCPPVPLPSVIGGLSLLVARGILHDRT
jgi:hypothetical protein